MSTSLKVKRNPRSQGQTNSNPAPQIMYIAHVQFNNRQLNYWFSQDTVYDNKSSPEIAEGRIIKGLLWLLSIETGNYRRLMEMTSAIMQFLIGPSG